MADQVFAVLGLVFCALVWGSMALGPARTQRLRHRASAWLQRARAGRRGAARTRAPREADTRQARETDTRQAREAAAAAIERARRAAQVERDGNVYRPDRFQPRKDDPNGRDKLH